MQHKTIKLEHNHSERTNITMYSLSLTVLCLLLIGNASGGDFHDALEGEGMAGAKEHNTGSIRRNLKMNKQKENVPVPSKSGMMMKKNKVFAPAPTTTAAPTAAAAISKSMMGMGMKGGMMKKSASMKSSMMNKSMGKSTKTAPAAFQVVNTCVTDGSCIRATDGAIYDIRESCEWSITSAATLSVSFFDLENNFDFVFVGSLAGFTGNGTNTDGIAIDGLVVSAGDVLEFRSDSFQSNQAGFEICLV